MSPLDLSLFQWIAGGASPTAAVLLLARAMAVGGPWLCIGLMGWAAWRQPGERGQLMALLAMAGATSLLSHGVADALGFPRPFVLGLAPAHIAHRASPALPSTHAAVMGLVALGLAWRPALRRLAWPAAACALLTGWARIYVGVHFPSDILAGFVLSCAAMAVFLLVQWIVRHLLAPAFARIQQRPPDGPAHEARDP